MVDPGSIDGLRARIRELLAQCEGLIADCRLLAERRPAAAPDVAPDEIIEVYRVRDWARGALAALDAGRELPPLPGPGR